MNESLRAIGEKPKSSKSETMMSNRFSLDNPRHETAQQEVLERTEPESELLVAYLDGELDAQSVRQMEDRLAVEPDLRGKMTSLEQTWNLLDALGTVPADKELVRSTMEVVTLTIAKEVNEDEKRLEQRKWLDRLVMVATVLMFGIIGYQLAVLVGIHRQNQLLKDIPIIQHINLYKEIDSFDFLQALSEKRVFDPSTSDALPLDEIPLIVEETQP